ncbi:hypothetical protein VULLAG_LOCUS15451 [Vulpes lagopus]
MFAIYKAPVTDFILMDSSQPRGMNGLTAEPRLVEGQRRALLSRSEPRVFSVASTEASEGDSEAPAMPSPRAPAARPPGGSSVSAFRKAVAPTHWCSRSAPAPLRAGPRPRPPPGSAPRARAQSLRARSPPRQLPSAGATLSFTALSAALSPFGTAPPPPPPPPLPPPPVPPYVTRRSAADERSPRC